MLDHERGDGPNQLRGASEINGNLIIPVLVLHAEQGLEGLDSGDGGDNVDTGEVRLDVCDGLVQGVDVPLVGLNGHEFGAVRFDQTAGLGEICCVGDVVFLGRTGALGNIEACNVAGASLGEGHGNGTANAASGACHEGGLAVEREWIGHCWTGLVVSGANGAGADRMQSRMGEAVFRTGRALSGSFFMTRRLFLDAGSSHTLEMQLCPLGPLSRGMNDCLQAPDRAWTPEERALFRSNDLDHPLSRHFQRFIEERDFPCVGAKAALNASRLEIMVARDITSSWDDLRIYPSLLAFARGYAVEPVLFQSFAVVFDGPLDLDESGFEQALWARVQSLTDKDVHGQQAPDLRVAHDPSDPHFSLSFGGQGFFVVGLHPNASRRARRFERPVLVFNLHDQFAQLRADGRYEKLRRQILARDSAFSGGINPMLARHGEMSEARQYSGRMVDETWLPPYRRAE